MLPARHAGPHAAWAQRLPIPGVIAKDAVGLCNHMPAFDVRQDGILGLTGLDVLCIEFAIQPLHLRFCKRHHFVLTERVRFGLLSSVPGMGPSRFKWASRDWRSSFGG